MKKVNGTGEYLPCCRNCFYWTENSFADGHGTCSRYAEESIVQITASADTCEEFSPESADEEEEQRTVSLKN